MQTYNKIMPMPTKPSRRAKRRPVRQSVTIPPTLAAEVRRVAKARHITMSHALVTLQHLLDRVQEREISLPDPRRLQAWVKSEPYAPEGDW